MKLGWVLFCGAPVRVLRRRPEWLDPWTGERDHARLRVQDTSGRIFWVREAELD